MMEKPDGAWAWVVVVAASCIRIIVYGNSYTSGVVYYVMLDVFKENRAQTSWIASVITAAVFATCPVSGVLVNRFGTRKVALVGSVVASAGLMLSAFATSLPILALCYGVITGIGCGLTFIPGSVAVARYFTDKRRNIAMGIASAGGGVGTFLFPPIINYLNEEYTWRGMFIILSGISLNICVFAMLYRPVAFKSSTDDNQQSKRKTHALKFLKLCDFHLFGINNILYQLGSSMVYGHLGTYALQLNIDKFHASILYSFTGVTVMVCKILQGFLIQNPKWRILQPYYQYMLWYAVGGVACICLLVINSYSGLVIISILFGVSYAACGGSLIPAILIDMAGIDQFSLSYGVILMEQAIGMLFGPPIAGLLFDKLYSYDSAFVMAGVLMILSAAITIFPCRNYQVRNRHNDITIVVKDRKNKKGRQNERGIHEEDKLISANNNVSSSGTKEVLVTQTTRDVVDETKRLTENSDF